MPHAPNPVAAAFFDNTIAPQILRMLDFSPYSDDLSHLSCNQRLANSAHEFQTRAFVFNTLI